MASRARTALERAVNRAGGQLRGYGTGRSGQTYARISMGGRTVQVPMRGKGGGSGSAGG